MRNEAHSSHCQNPCSTLIRFCCSLAMREENDLGKHNNDLSLLNTMLHVQCDRRCSDKDEEVIVCQNLRMSRSAVRHCEASLPKLLLILIFYLSTTLPPSIRSALSLEFFGAPLPFAL